MAGRDAESSAVVWRHGAMLEFHLISLIFSLLLGMNGASHAVWCGRDASLE